MSIILVDTSIFCNIVPVPGRDQDRAMVLQQLRHHITNRANLLLPLVTILETGNHIAHIPSGGQRRTTAEGFVHQVRDALDHRAPWTVAVPLVNERNLWVYLNDFPQVVVDELGLGDLLIIKEFERQCALHSAQRVLIWSLDEHLSAYDQQI